MKIYRNIKAFILLLKSGRRKFEVTASRKVISISIKRLVLQAVQASAIRRIWKIFFKL